MSPTDGPPLPPAPGIRRGIPVRTGGVSPFERLGDLVARRHRWIVAIWVVLLLAAVPFAPRVVESLRAGGFTSDDLESARARQVLQAELGLAPSAVVIVLESDRWLAGTPEFEAAAAKATQNLPTRSPVAGYVTHLVSPRLVSEDRRTVYDVVLLDLAPDDSPAALPVLEERLREVDGLRAAIAGGPAFYGDVQDVTESDLRRSEIVSLPLAALALLVVFGSVVAAGVPLAVGGASVVLALALIWAIGSVVPMSIFVL